MERPEFDLLFRWFVGVGVDDPVSDHSTQSRSSGRCFGHIRVQQWRCEADEISGGGSTELQDAGSIKIELSFDNGDDAVLAARRE